MNWTDHNVLYSANFYNYLQVNSETIHTAEYVLFIYLKKILEIEYRHNCCTVELLPTGHVSSVDDLQGLAVTMST